SRYRRQPGRIGHGCRRRLDAHLERPRRPHRRDLLEQLRHRWRRRRGWWWRRRRHGWWRREWRQRREGGQGRQHPEGMPRRRGGGRGGGGGPREHGARRGVAGAAIGGAARAGGGGHGGGGEEGRWEGRAGEPVPVERAAAVAQVGSVDRRAREPGVPWTAALAG